MSNEDKIILGQYLLIDEVKRIMVSGDVATIEFDDYHLTLDTESAEEVFREVKGVDMFDLYNCYPRF